MLLIDDEADNASINTHNADTDPTAINKAIRELLNKFLKSDYLGFTATPYANIFIDPETEDDMFNEDLFPEILSIVCLHHPITLVRMPFLQVTENIGQCFTIMMIVKTMFP